MAPTLSTSTTDKISNEKSSSTLADYKNLQLSKLPQTEVDMEKGFMNNEAVLHNRSVSSLSPHSLIMHGRPDAAARIQEIVDKTESSDSTIVAACGPEELMLQVRRAVVGVVGTGRRSVCLHCEQFGW